MPLGLDRDLGAADALRQRRRHVLLERDAAAERVVVGQVDDAEAAFAEDLDDLELAQTECRPAACCRLRGRHARGAAGGGGRGRITVASPSGSKAPAGGAISVRSRRDFRALGRRARLRRARRQDAGRFVVVVDAHRFTSLPCLPASPAPRRTCRGCRARSRPSCGAAAQPASRRRGPSAAESRTCRAGRLRGRDLGAELARLRFPGAEQAEDVVVRHRCRRFQRSRRGTRLEHAKRVVLGEHLADGIERTRARVAVDLEQGEDVVVGQQLARRRVARRHRRRTAEQRQQVVVARRRCGGERRSAEALRPGRQRILRLRPPDRGRRRPTARRCRRRTSG